MGYLSIGLFVDVLWLSRLNPLGPGFESLRADCVIRLNFSVNFAVNERQVCDRGVWVAVCSVWAVTSFSLVVITAVSEEHAASIFSAFVHGLQFMPFQIR